MMICVVFALKNDILVDILVLILLFLDLDKVSYNINIPLVLNFLNSAFCLFICFSFRQIFSKR